MLNSYRRSLLYVPGDNSKMLNKSFDRPCDSIIIDLEDAIAPDHKDEARDLTEEFVLNADRTKELFIRINDVNSPYYKKDLEMAIRSKVDGVVLPKACLDAVEILESDLNKLDKNADMPYIALIESAIGLVELRELIICGKRLIAIQFGAEDYTRDLEIERTKSGDEVEFARYIIGLNCKSYCVQAIDTPFTDYKDDEGLKYDIEIAKRTGMKAKTCIHPDQIEMINQMFVPSSAEVAFAKRVTEEASKTENISKGAFSLDGKMVDKRVIERAKLVLERTKAYNLI